MHLHRADVKNHEVQDSQNKAKEMLAVRGKYQRDREVNKLESGDQGQFIKRFVWIAQYKPNA